MKRWVEIWAGMACVAAVFLVGLVGFAPAEGAVRNRQNTSKNRQDPSINSQDVSWSGARMLKISQKSSEQAGGTASAAEPISLPEALRVVFGNQVTEMPLEEYVYGVVAAEMPAAFPDAALEAQAVAARTYALYQRSAGKHAEMGGDVCGESTCCQAFITQAELDGRWGNEAAFYTQKLRGAVERTAGEVLTYGGELAAAVYHASSDGRTRAAAEVWGGAQPYLVAVDTPEETGEKGHGVGMSQRGAQALALEGYSYREILGHYYPGTEIVGG